MKMMGKKGEGYEERCLDVTKRDRDKERESTGCLRRKEGRRREGYLEGNAERRRRKEEEEGCFLIGEEGYKEGTASWGGKRRGGS